MDAKFLSEILDLYLDFYIKFTVENVDSSSKCSFPKIELSTSLKNFIYLFIYFWLCWVFVAARGLSLVVASGGTLRCGARASHCGGFSLQSMDSRRAGFSSCGSRAQ